MLKAIGMRHANESLHGTSARAGKSWANWKWTEDKLGKVGWCLRFVMDPEENLAGKTTCP